MADPRKPPAAEGRLDLLFHLSVARLFFMEITLSREVMGLVRLGVFELRNCRIRSDGAFMEDLLSSKEEEIRARFQGMSPREIPQLRPARRLYRAAGLDPTRNRPSSEALTRRILKGKALPRINSAVDLCNLCAVTYFLPIGLYDLGRIAPPVRARLGKKGEAYEGLGKPEVHLEGRFCLEDLHGPFGNPSSDSKRTSVDESTENLLWVIYAPSDYEEDRLMEHLRWSIELAMEHGLCGGSGEPLLVPPSFRGARR